MQKSKFSKRRLAVVLTISLFTILSVKAFGLSVVLDTYSGTGFSDVGKISADPFTITGGDFYTKTEITASQRWPNTYAGITLTPMLKSGFGYTAITSKSNSFTAYSWTGPVVQSFTGLTNGTYKIYFKSQYKENGLAFEGTAYDNKQ